MRQPRFRLRTLAFPAVVTIGLLIVSATAVLPAATQGLSWADVDGVKIPVPPPQHPRLYLRAEHVAQLPARLRDPVLQPVVKRLEMMAGKSAQQRIEWETLQYLVEPKTVDGRTTIARALALLKRTELADRQDACRETGRMMVTGAIVYDWLYPLLTKEDKQAFVAELVRLAFFKLRFTTRRTVIARPFMASASGSVQRTGRSARSIRASVHGLRGWSSRRGSDNPAAP